MFLELIKILPPPIVVIQLLPSALQPQLNFPDPCSGVLTSETDCTRLTRLSCSIILLEGHFVRFVLSPASRGSPVLGLFLVSEGAIRCQMLPNVANDELKDLGYAVETMLVFLRSEFSWFLAWGLATQRGGGSAALAHSGLPNWQSKNTRRC